jgi:hypothetical protein
MPTNTDWQDIASSCSVAEFATKNNLDVQRLSCSQGVVILPNNITLSKIPEQHLFSAHAKEVLFLLQESGIDASFYQDERERRELVLKHATVVLPALYFLGSAISAVALNLLSSWIFERFVKNRKPEPPANIKCEYAELKSDGSVRWRRVEGPADHVCKLLQQESSRLGGEIGPGSQAVPSKNNRSPEQWNINQKNRRKKALPKHRS